jgi:hypothetical protein
VFQARWEGNLPSVFLPSQNRADKAAQERASRSSRIEKASFGFPVPTSPIWDAATGLPVTPVFPSRYTNNEVDYRTVKLASFSSSRRESALTSPEDDVSGLTSAATSQPTFAFPTSAFSLEPSDFRPLAELLSGSQLVGRSLGEGWLDGTGGWKPLELGEIVARWNELNGKYRSSANRQN